MQGSSQDGPDFFVGTHPPLGLDKIDPADYQGWEDEGTLHVPKAGEILYRLKDAPDWQKA